MPFDEDEHLNSYDMMEWAYRVGQAQRDLAKAKELVQELHDNEEILELDSEGKLNHLLEILQWTDLDIKR